MGCFAGMCIIGYLSILSGSGLIIPSFAASCAIGMTIPESAFAQPRNVIAGHLFSSLFIMTVSTCPMEIALRRQLPALLALLLANGMALADIKIGVIASSTGPTAVVGIPQKQTVALLPTEIGGQKVEYIVLDDASDPSAAARNARNSSPTTRGAGDRPSSRTPGRAAKAAASRRDFARPPATATTTELIRSSARCTSVAALSTPLATTGGG